MPEERVTTGSEPRRYTIWVHRKSGVVLRDPDAWGLDEIEKVDVIEVEPGHDEQTEERLREERDNARRELRAQGGHAAAAWKDRAEKAEAALADERERTVAAVVEEVDRWYHGKPPIHKPLLEHLAERFKPSAPGGDR